MSWNNVGLWGLSMFVLPWVAVPVFFLLCCWGVSSFHGFLHQVGLLNRDLGITATSVALILCGRLCSPVFSVCCIIASISCLRAQSNTVDTDRLHRIAQTDTMPRWNISITMLFTPKISVGLGWLDTGEKTWWVPGPCGPRWPRSAPWASFSCSDWPNTVRSHAYWRHWAVHVGSGRWWRGPCNSSPGPPSLTLPQIIGLFKKIYYLLLCMFFLRNSPCQLNIINILPGFPGRSVRSVLGSSAYL